MKLFEFEGKAVLSRCGIGVPAGEVAATVAEASAAARAIGGPVMVKAQVLCGARGKAGLVARAGSPEEAGTAAAALLSREAGGETVATVLVETCVPVAQELYMAVTLDAELGQPLFLLSTSGGIEVEEAARTGAGPSSVPVDMLEGLQPYAVRALARTAGLTGPVVQALGETGAALYRAFRESDALLAEINPLAVTEAGDLVALDAKLQIDGYAGWRQPAWDPDRHSGSETPLERRARMLGLSYVALDGSIGIAGNGAGLMMMTVDMVSDSGGRPANFCDAGGAGARPGTGEGAIGWWRDVVGLVLDDPRVEVLLFNLHGGNHRGDEVAAGLLEALESGRKVPTVVRLSGTREREGRDLLRAAGVPFLETLDDAVAEAVRLSGTSV